jgi:hypothetical protein
MKAMSSANRTNMWFRALPFAGYESTSSELLDGMDFLSPRQGRKDFSLTSNQKQDATSRCVDFSAREG